LKFKAVFEMSTSVVIKKKLVRKPKVMVEEPPTSQEKSVWLSMRRIPKDKPLAIIWEHVEDISDDENDTPQAAGKRLSTLKATRDQIRRRAYENKLASLHSAGLFLAWGPPKRLETHSNYTFVYQRTAAYPY
jgi:hypothetical protein